MSSEPATPVLIGAAAAHQRLDEPGAGHDTAGLMIEAVQAAPAIIADQADEPAVAELKIDENRPEAAPAIIPAGAYAPEGVVGDPLAQALILTAIVIGFGVLAFAVVLIHRAHEVLGADDLDMLKDELQ